MALSNNFANGWLSPLDILVPGSTAVNKLLQGSSIWNDLTGISNTQAQNSAAAALQEDAQAFNAAESAAQRDFEAAEAQKNRDWQTEMSNTSYQRSVADLQAAGLNPWLAVNNGASTPSAVSVSGSAASSGIGSAQASNVNLLQSLGTTAAGIAMIIRAAKFAAK